MKKLFTTVLTMLTSIICFAQRGGTERSYEAIGLADGDEIAESLKIAIPLLIVGFLIAYIFMWSKKDTSKTDDASTNIGCFGIIIMAVGAFFLLPLLAWVEYIFVNIMTIGFAIVVVGVIIYFIYSALTKK
ncbi:hypothetical protein [Flavobacterium sp. J27]|uniref:hypothetical protein n=1 Tax=Flavobacterium sp. J27 TaxID=2060419 RepID=UPI0010306360|nr:hypothetical protein [Flavobacterium sp. J27]